MLLLAVGCAIINRRSQYKHQKKESFLIIHHTKTMTIKKRFVLLLSGLFSISVAVGQTSLYHPFPDSAFWRVDYQNFLQFQYPYEAYSYFHYYTTGDTLLNGKQHKKIFRSYVDYDLVNWTPPYNPPQPPVAGYAGALRDDATANKVYFVFAGTAADSLLYDYNLIEGDTLKGYISQSVYSNSNLVVLSVDSVSIDGQYRKRWNFANDYNGDSAYVIQGIGSSGGLIEPLNTYAIDFTYRHLVCVSRDTETLYTSTYNSVMGCTLIEGISDLKLENKINCYPNPFSTETTLQADILFNNATLKVFNSRGQLVKQQKNINGCSITCHRENLPCGLYLFKIEEDNKTYTGNKLLIVDK